MGTTGGGAALTPGRLRPPFFLAGERGELGVVLDLVCLLFFRRDRAPAGLRGRRQQLVQAGELAGEREQLEEGVRELEMQGVFRAGGGYEGRGHVQEEGAVRAHGEHHGAGEAVKGVTQLRPSVWGWRFPQAGQGVFDRELVGGLLVEVIPYFVQKKFPEQAVRPEPRPMNLQFHFGRGGGRGWGRGRGAGRPGRGRVFGRRGCFALL